jgi:hypothetical protein
MIAGRQYVLEHIVARVDHSLHDGGRAMERELVRNEWGAIGQHAGFVELRWLPDAPPMSDGAFMATLCLLATEAEKERPRGLLIDAVTFRHSFGPGVMAWRDASVVPRYGAAGVRRFAFVMPPSFPGAGTESVEGPAVFTTRWFTVRDEAVRWLMVG